MGFSYINDTGELVMARFTELKPNDRIADWYAHNEVWGSPNIDSSHRCILRCPQCLRQKKEGGPRIKRAYDLEVKEDAGPKLIPSHLLNICSMLSSSVYSIHLNPSLSAISEILSNLSSYRVVGMVAKTITGAVMDADLDTSYCICFPKQIEKWEAAGDFPFVKYFPYLIQTIGKASLYKWQNMSADGLKKDTRAPFDDVFEFVD